MRDLLRKRTTWAVLGVFAVLAVVVAWQRVPLLAWHHVRNAMQAALDNPETAGHEYAGYFGPTTFAETVDTFYSGDLLVHSWDVARGAGLTDLEALDSDDMRRTRLQLEPLGDVLRSGGVYGEAVELSGNETEQQQFLAWTGRTA